MYIMYRERNSAEKNIRPFVWQTAARYDDISRNNITYASSYIGTPAMDFPETFFSGWTITMSE